MSYCPKLIYALFFILLITNLLFLFCKFSNASDTLTSSQSIVDGQTLVAKDGNYELGFFSPGSSRKRSFGIWYKKVSVRTVVWVANQRNAINDSSSLLTIDRTSKNLVLISKNSLVWSSNSTKEAQNPVAQLLDSGNLVLRDEKNGNSGTYLWQSFDYPTDTLLAGMKIGVKLKPQRSMRLVSWKNWDDPSPGDFVWDLRVVHDIVESAIWKGSGILMRSGPWNGISFSGIPQLRPNQVYDFKFERNEEEVYILYHQKDDTVIYRPILNQTNNRLELLLWDKTSQSWLLQFYLPSDHCDSYGICGRFGICKASTTPDCQCLKGFSPKSPEKWYSADFSQGCVRNNSLNCSSDGFIKFPGLKLPDITDTWANESMNLNECRSKCFKNCSCTAYTSYDIRNGGSGCIIWFSDLIDIREIAFGGQDLYIRMSASELVGLEDVGGNQNKKMMVIIIPSVIATSGILAVSYYYFKSRKKLKEKNKMQDKNQESDEELELPLFDFATISHATNKFSFGNKLGQGGFGPVYKGILSDGKEIAVKRLSSNSGQGLIEFKNEVKLIAKLQHRNLVKLHGCCIKGDERLLIYDYMPNKSLDYFIFDQSRAKLLDWSKRFKIVCGIARGLLYLHQDSRLRIIHRDLKPSNVLLDNEMNPKISDFGMARTFGGDQTEGNTRRVVGTYGYMAPEYASDGLFSVKSDVFSFGILMLETTTGKRSRGFYHPDHSVNLIGYAWRLWNEGNVLELVESFLMESCSLLEVKRCIHISLLCVQQHAEDRPSMASVVLMLGSKNELPQPKKPGFLIESRPLETQSPSSNPGSSSKNEISLSELQGR
ncbi:hypothetical protein JCGZ_00749 [Jatropha curcas]|uniref:Receptor-like serine/threonine-protein kinase n=1 Tax=Jatropha curcas TaxID=180498 RepID=A0A067KS82_JATCU|nr:hypothetical protein JCGZ_00749 [Jatropha curcas]